MYSRPTSPTMRRAAEPPAAAVFIASFTPSTCRLQR
jgi:hypothetical protein